MSDHALDLLIDQDWRDNAWITTTSGDGVNSATSGILTATASTGNALRSFWVPVLPGAHVEVEVFGRKVSGGATGTGVYLRLVDQADSGSEVAAIELTAVDWKAHTIGYTVPISQGTDTRFIKVDFGVKSGSTGSGQFQLPVIRISRGQGMPMVVARGVVQCLAGTPGLLSDRANHGINGVSFNGTDTLTVTLRHAFPSSPKPLVFLTGEQGQPTRIPMAGTVTVGLTTTIQIKFTNGAAIQNISAGNTFAYLMVLW